VGNDAIIDGGSASRLHVIHISPTVPSLNNSVPDNVIIAATAINSERWSASVYAPTPAVTSITTACDDPLMIQFPVSLPWLQPFRHAQVSLSLSQALRDNLHTFNIVHAHGLWIFPNFCAAKTSIRTGKPYVVSTRGMLAEKALAFSRTGKRAAWLAFQHRQLNRASCIIATSDDERRHIRRNDLTVPIAVVPPGLVLPSVASIVSPREKSVLFLGRLHPIKALNNLLHAWGDIEKLSDDWQLLVAGPDEAGYRTTLSDLAASLGLRNLHFLGPIYGEEKQALLSRVAYLILPSHSENYGAVVAEALSFGVPVIASTGTPWSMLRDRKAGWWIDNSPQEISCTLTEAICLSSVKWSELSRNATKLAREALSHEREGEQLRAVYEWACGLRASPSHLFFD
jgi:glycosyltransferase involved in cell wall biosynthesis